MKLIDLAAIVATLMALIAYTAHDYYFCIAFCVGGGLALRASDIE